MCAKKSSFTLFARYGTKGRFYITGNDCCDLLHELFCKIIHDKMRLGFPNSIVLLLTFNEDFTELFIKEKLFAICEKHDIIIDLRVAIPETIRDATRARAELSFMGKHINRELLSRVMGIPHFNPFGDEDAYDDAFPRYWSGTLKEETGVDIHHFWDETFAQVAAKPEIKSLADTLEGGSTEIYWGIYAPKPFDYCLTSSKISLLVSIKASLRVFFYQENYGTL